MDALLQALLSPTTRNEIYEYVDPSDPQNQPSPSELEEIQDEALNELLTKHPEIDVEQISNEEWRKLVNEKIAKRYRHGHHVRVNPELESF